MPTSLLEHLFSFFQHLLFQHIGSKLRTNFLKNIMDRVFIVFERIGSKFECISAIYLKMYQDILTQEISIAQVSEQDKVLVIGGGSLPVTPIFIVQNTHAQTVAIDKDPIAVKDAIQFIHSQKLENILKIEYADGLTYPVERFTIIFILYGINHPSAMLQYLASRIDKNTKIIFRTITDIQGNLLDRTLDLQQYFIIKNQIRTEGIGTIDSFLLMKK
jgi:precorrin-6B methylase 2